MIFPGLQKRKSRIAKKKEKKKNNMTQKNGFVNIKNNAYSTVLGKCIS